MIMRNEEEVERGKKKEEKGKEKEREFEIVLFHQPSQILYVYLKRAKKRSHKANIVKLHILPPFLDFSFYSFLSIYHMF